MKFLCLSLVIFTIAFSNAQQDSLTQIGSNTYNQSIYGSHEITDYFKSVSFNIGAGLFIPQGTLQDYLGISPLAELNLNLPLKREKSIDLGIQFIIPNQTREFSYVRVEDTLQTESTFMFNAFLKFKVNVLSPNKNSRLNINTAFGVSSITTDARNPNFGNNEDDTKYEMVTAFLISPGLEYELRLKDDSVIKMGANLHYSPYKIEGALQENIGGIALIPKLSYRF